ncbi:sigma-70 family RNA polymerase sigma factor [Streptosporangium roseum]|uniref:sigma-70 family RNA polymerase sigma factor n=1 Tax=Streptosporangium roseum TaxID=2001 RepID=UPI003333B8A5
MTDFAERAERHRGELRVHCYRMLGSFDEAEDLVQEVFLRAWRGRDGFEGRSSLRAWLYRIATNACLDFLDGRSRRTLPDQADSPAGPWLQPFPGHLWEPVAPSADDPEAVVVAKETLELAFLAAIQHLPPRQRAATILCDVLGWQRCRRAGTPAHPTTSERCACCRRAPTASWPRRRTGVRRAGTRTSRSASACWGSATAG